MRTVGGGLWHASTAVPLYSIGHSNHPLQHFLDLLGEHGIEALVDVRSIPSSRYSPHFSRAPLERALTRAGIQYVYMGRDLGGRPEGAEFYDTAGKVLYARVARSPLFQERIDRLVANFVQQRTAIMCSEEDPAMCHRHLLLGRVLARREVPLLHIRGDGRIEDEVAPEPSGRKRRPPASQMSFLEDHEEQTWKSSRSVLPRNPPHSSSEP